ncbi:MAG: hypothetical protein EOM02_00865 [Synergistales bacterium]|nr:hypothetical protein [Synergistales bacterium]
MSLFQSDYGYLNARLRGRWGAFYAPSFFDSLSEENLESLEQAMLKGPYSPHYRRELASTRSSVLERIEKAATSGASERIRSVEGFATGEAKELIPILSMGGEIFNSRVLLRKFQGHDSRSGRPQWHDYGPLGAFFFDSVWEECSTPMEAIERCYTSGKPTAVPLARSLEVFLHTGSFFDAERCYMSGIIEWCLKPLGGVSPGKLTVGEFLARSIDLWNIQIWFRKGVGSEIKAGDYLAGGTIGIDILEKNRDVYGLLSGSLWSSSALTPGITFPVLGRFLQNEFLRWQIGLFRSDILGIGVAIAYMARQVLEWRNMEILAVGLSANLPPERIRRLLWRL